MTKIFFLVLISFSLFISCHKEDVLERPFPRIHTLEVSEINSEGATFTAEIMQFNDEDIIDHGFVWGNRAPNLDRSFSISNGAKLDDNSIFSIAVKTGLKAGESYLVRSYIKTPKTTVYGNVQSFISLGSAGPKVLEIFPESGYPGDTIKIIGENFISGSSDISIKFNDIESPVISSSMVEIHVIVPDEIATKENTISISIGEDLFPFPGEFIILDPQISDYTPNLGNSGELMSINGKRLGLFKKMQVKIGNSITEILEVTEDNLNIVVPDFDQFIYQDNIDMNTTREIKLYPFGPHESSHISVGFFEYIFPVPSSFFPGTGSYGDTITISGTNLDSFKEIYGLMIGPDYFGTIISHSETEIKVTIPNKTTEINNLIRLQASGYEYTLEGTFIMDRPAITNVNPQEFSVGDEISISVYNPNPVLSYNHFTMNDYYTEPVSKNGNEIVIKVPADLEGFTGDVFLEFSTGEWFNSSLHDKYDTPLRIIP